MIDRLRRWCLLVAATQLAATPAFGQDATESSETAAPISPAQVASDAALEAATPTRRFHSLAALLALAESRYPGLDAADASIDAAEARLREARTSPFMQFQLELGAAMIPNSSGTPIYTPNGQLGNLRSWGPAASVQFSGALPLYTFGKIRDTWTMAEAGISAAEHARERSRLTLRYDLRRAYYGLSFALDVLQMISEGEGKLARALETFDERIEEGDSDLEPMDRYRLAAALAELRARRSQAELAETSATAALRAMTGLDEVAIADCPLQAVTATIADADALTTDIARPELAMLRDARVVRAAELSMHRARYYPDLVLAMTAGYSVAPSVTDVTNPYIQDRANNRTLGFGIAARWSLDFGGTRRRVERARAQLAEIDAQIEEATLGATLEIELARARLADADARLAAWSEGERQTRRWLVAAAQGQQVGAVEPKALVDAVKAYFAARLARLEATLDHDVQLAQLERITGVPLVDEAAWEPRCE